MSLRIALALAATIGTGMLMSSGAEARPAALGFRGDDSPGTIAVKPEERRLYRALNQGPAFGKAGKRRAGRHRNPVSSPPREVTQDAPSTELKSGSFPFDPMAARQ